MQAVGVVAAAAAVPRMSSVREDSYSRLSLLNSYRADAEDGRSVNRVRRVFTIVWLVSRLDLQPEFDDAHSATLNNRNFNRFLPPYNSITRACWALC